LLICGTACVRWAAHYEGVKIAIADCNAVKVHPVLKRLDAAEAAHDCLCTLGFA
jgi:hypothetical protein